MNANELLSQANKTQNPEDLRCILPPKELVIEIIDAVSQTIYEISKSPGSAITTYTTELRGKIASTIAATVYAYTAGIYPSHEIEDLCQTDPLIKYLAGNHELSQYDIRNTRKHYRKLIENALSLVLRKIFAIALQSKELFDCNCQKQLSDPFSESTKRITKAIWLDTVYLDD